MSEDCPGSSWAYCFKYDQLKPSSRRAEWVHARPYYANLSSNQSYVTGPYKKVNWAEFTSRPWCNHGTLALWRIFSRTLVHCIWRFFPMIHALVICITKYQTLLCHACAMLIVTLAGLYITSGNSYIPPECHLCVRGDIFYPYRSMIKPSFSINLSVFSWRMLLVFNSYLDNKFSHYYVV